MKFFLRSCSLIATLVAFGCASHSQPAAINLLAPTNFYRFVRNFGIDNDPENIFTWDKGVLHITGQHYGYLSTKSDYSNYRLVAEFKWGEKTWAPREKTARDSGVLVHCVGKDPKATADWIWPTCLEAQIIEGGTGDILVVSGASLTVDGVKKGPKTERFDRPGRNPWEDVKGFRGPHEIEKPVGEWNRMEIVCDGDKLSISVNGHKTNEGTNASPQSGRILLQSEGAEIFFRRLDLYPLAKTATR
jgi:hypothetical protein